MGAKRGASLDRLHRLAVSVGLLGLLTMEAGGEAGSILRWVLRVNLRRNTRQGSLASSVDGDGRN